MENKEVLNLMAQISTEMIKSHGEYMEKTEKNPKQIFIDFISNMKTDATRADSYIKSGNKDVASDYIGRILGGCEAMLSVLNNTN